MVIVISGFNNNGKTAFWTCYLAWDSPVLCCTVTFVSNTGVFAHGSYNLYICLYMHVFSYGIFKNCTQSSSHASHSIPAPTTSYKLVTFRYILLSATYHLLRYVPPSSSPQQNSPHWTPEKDILKTELNIGMVPTATVQLPYNTAVHWTYHSCT